MTSTVSDPVTISRALWFASVAACLLAIVLTLLVRRVQLVLRRATKIRVVSGTVIFTLSLVAYIAALVAFYGVGTILLNRDRLPEERTFVGVSWVHPGIVHHLLPLASIITTWSVISARQRGSQKATG